MATDQIDELIEESYLLSLPEQDVRTHLKAFLNACEVVLKQNLTARRDLRIVGVKVALLRAKFLLNAKSLPSPKHATAGPKNPGQLLIQQVLQTKRLVRRLLGGVDAGLIAALDREEKRFREHPNSERSFSWRVAGKSVGYYSVLISILFMLLVYLGQ